MTVSKAEKIWYQTDFAFASADQCQCYKHTTRTGNRTRCSVRNCSVALADPDRPDRSHRLYCLDCWATCRTEQTVPNPAQTRMYQEQKRNGFGLMAMGC